MGEISELELDLAASAELLELADAMFLQVPVTDEYAAALADLMSLILDVGIAMEYADRYVECAMDQAVVADHWMLAALWSAMLITYRRAFTSGATLVRKGARFRGLKRVIPDQLPDDLSAIHNAFLRIADKHVAHRADDAYESCTVAAGLLAEPLPRTYVGVRVEPIRGVCPEISQAAQLSRLCTAVLQALSELFHERFAAACAHYKSLDIDVLYRLVQQPTAAASDRHQSMARVDLNDITCPDSLSASIGKVLYPLLFTGP